MAAAMLNSMEAPIPCMIRKTISWLRSPETPHNREETVNGPRPILNIFALPVYSAIRQKNIRRLVCTTR